MADGERDAPEDKSSPLILISWLDWQKSSAGIASISLAAIEQVSFM